MYKKSIAFIVCILLILCFPFCVFATEEEPVPEEIEIVQLSIGTTEEFLIFAENCRLDSYSRNLAITITDDLDLTQTEFSGIPIFCGSFNGAGYTITYALHQEGSVQGLFRYLTADATVENLNVRAQIIPGGSQSMIGSVAGENSGIIRSCTFSGTLQGADNIGGIAGINTVTGIIDRCSTDGDIHGNHFIGGIAGVNKGVIRNCENNCSVNTTSQQNTVEITDITIDSITSSESSGTTTDIGGIAGQSMGVIRRCTNRGNVGYRQMGYNVGGIAGTQSGYIVDCENYGTVYGRKEVGGIAGQLEPAAKIEYSVDTLQILEQQLDTMSALTASASANAQASASTIANQLTGITDQVTSAQEAIEQLVPTVDPENPDAPVTMPDEDTLLAAQTALSGAMSGMQTGLNNISSTAQGLAYNLSRDMKAITNQMEAMGQTLNAASDGLGGSVSDVSDADTDADITGKIAYSHNYGSVYADMNTGGIVGAMAPENDLDIQDDLEILGEASLNFESELRAVVLGCENSATITVNKQNGGGIAGLMTMGLVRSCVNTGPVLSDSADYVGGIAGQSQGYIRSCCTKCLLSGDSYIGGIAGNGTVVSDCRAMNKLTGSEKLGGVLGYAENRDDITGNYYAAANADPGAIDSISYDTAAQKLDVDVFLNLESLPAIFRNITVTFRSEESTTKKVIPLGQELDPADIPELPQKAGYTARWDGLEEGAVLFDHTVEAVYTPYETVIAFSFDKDEGAPIVLAQGSFSPDAVLELEELDSKLSLQPRQILVAGYTLRINEPQPMTLRYFAGIPDTERCSLWVRSDGVWEHRDFVQDGSYLVFCVGQNADAFCLIKNSPNYLLCIGIALLLCGGVCVCTIAIHKKRKKA